MTASLSPWEDEKGIKMLMQIYDEDGFTDEFESRVLENIIVNTSEVFWVKEENDCDFYVLKKQDLPSLIEQLQEEKIRQREKSLFKRKATRTLKELQIVVGILNVLQNDSSVQTNEEVVMFTIGKSTEMLDI